MKVSHLRSHILLVLVSILFVIGGHLFVPQRDYTRPDGALAVRGDSVHYVAMIEGKWDAAAVPFQYRVLVPFLAGLLPLSPLASLRVISYISLFLCYYIILLTCLQMGSNLFQSAIGLFAIWGTTWHLYYYNNPFLTDPFGLLVLCGMIFALASEYFLIFSSFALFGVLARETTLFLVPVWSLTKQFRSGALVVAMAVGIFFLPRYFLSSQTNLLEVLHTAFYEFGAHRSPVQFINRILLSWGFIWFLSLVGIWFVPEQKFIPITTAFLALLLGAIITALIAHDIGRMFSILMPIFVIVNTQLFSLLTARGHTLGALSFVGLMLGQVLTSFPNVLLNDQILIYYLLKFLVLILGTIYSACIVFILRGHLRQAIIEKLAGIQKTF